MTPALPRDAGLRGRARSIHAGPGWLLFLMAPPTIALDVVLAGAISATCSGRGWCWPPTADLTGVVVGTVVHPAAPAAAWPARLSSRLPAATAYWAAFFVLAATTAGAAAVISNFWRWIWRPVRKRGLAASGQGRARYSHLAVLRLAPWRQHRFSGRTWASPFHSPPATSSPFPDHRDRYGFASYRQLQREASVAAARRRATQTRPSLAKGKRRLAPHDVGYPLGRTRPGGMELWPSWEASLRLVGPPGEGKTFRALVPVLRQHPGPVLATSTKADLFELSAIARERRGPVFALDPDLLAPAAKRARWSPVAGCERSEVAERRASAFLAATGEDVDVHNGAFFRDSARDLLKAYLHAAAVAALDIRAVLEWSRRPEDPTPAELLVGSPWSAPGWADLITLHTTGAAETTSGVLRYVARALACFSHEAVVEACCPMPGDELNIENLLRDNGTLYLLGKGSRLGAVAPLMTALADEVFDCAERLAERMPARRLDPPMLGLLDEAPSIAPVPVLPELLADGRGRGIVVVYSMQSFSQAVTRWGAQRADTMTNATTITAVLGGLTSPGDLADLERVCGQRLVRRESTHRGMSGANGRDHSRTVSWETEAVMRADQIRTLPAGTALVLWSRLPPVLAHLPLLSETPTWTELEIELQRARAANDRARSLQLASTAGYSAAHLTDPLENSNETLTSLFPAAAPFK
jgi:type IV secretory pathway TraG/TraD family ATPase VirD4